MALLCAGVGCGGPISDWPNKDHEDEKPGDTSSDDGEGGDAPASPADGDENAGAGEDDEKEPSTGAPPSAGARDAGTAGRGDLDASASPTEGGGLSGSGDGGPPDAESPPDAQTFGGERCRVVSDGRDAGACYGIYCQMGAAELERDVRAEGACLAPGDLALACDGELARATAACAQANVLALGFGGVGFCAHRAPSLAEASSGCIDCYVEETLCAVQSCLVPCLDGASRACTACRRESCGPAFHACSGLPTPTSARDRSVDAGG